jgi:hypothetical protein
MAQTFDIRFAKSAGLASLFEAPTNEYRWKGAGRLSIDPTGVSIAARRGLLTLFARATTRRIPTNSLIGVYREGNALRLEFSTQESARAVLPIWVGDRDSAAQIVTLLPTQRSVELEGGDPEAPRRYRFDHKLIALLLIGVVALAVGALALARHFAADRATPLVEGDSDLARPATRDSTIAPPPQAAAPMPVSSAGGFDPSNSPIYLQNPIARREFERFQAESYALRAEYSSIRVSPTAEDLEALEARWGEVIARIYNTSDFEGIEFVTQREVELAVARSWRYYLSIHAAGLRASDPRLIELAAAHLEFTEALELRLSQFAL